jgi:hypothetical protein
MSECRMHFLCIQQIFITLCCIPLNYTILILVHCGQFDCAKTLLLCTILIWVNNL